MSTKIEWVINPDGSQGEAWNPLTGCLEGCPYCYARRVAARFGKTPEAKMFKPVWHPERLAGPARWRKPRSVFVGSMADLWGPWVDAGHISEVLAVVASLPRHRFMFLTKNPERYRKIQIWPRNAWVGATATDQASWDRAVRALMGVNARVRFISAEPLLGHIDAPLPVVRGKIMPSAWLPEWVIIGGQTGPGAVPPPSSADGKLAAALCARGVPVFIKNNLGWADPPQDFPEVAP